MLGDSARYCWLGKDDGGWPGQDSSWGSWPSVGTWGLDAVLVLVWHSRTHGLWFLGSASQDLLPTSPLRISVGGAWAPFPQPKRRGDSGRSREKCAEIEQQDLPWDAGPDLHAAKVNCLKRRLDLLLKHFKAFFSFLMGLRCTEFDYLSSLVRDILIDPAFTFLLFILWIIVPPTATMTLITAIDPRLSFPWVLQFCPRIYLKRISDYVSSSGARFFSTQHFITNCRRYSVFPWL